MNLEGDKIRCEALFNDTDSDCPISIDNDEKQMKNTKCKQVRCTCF